MNIIKFIPYGKDNAISRAALERLTGYKDRVNRKMIEKARTQHTILSLQDGNGYFQPLPEEKWLVERWVKQESSRENSIRRARLGAERFLSDDNNLIPVRSYFRRLHKDTEPKKQVTGQMRW